MNENLHQLTGHDLAKDQLRFEVSLDCVTYAGETTAHECLLEVELKSEYSHRASLKTLMDRLEERVPGLRTIAESKYCRGMRLVGFTSSKASPASHPESQ